MRWSFISWAANTPRSSRAASRWTPTPRCGCSPRNGSRRRAEARRVLCRTAQVHHRSHTRESGYPVRRGLSIPSSALWNTGSSAFADDDGRSYCPASRTSQPDSLHPLEPHALPVREPCRDVAAAETRLALRHLFLRAAQRLPPRRAVRRARQRRVDDLFDFLEAQHEFGQRLLLQTIPQQVVIIHGRSRISADRNNG